MVLTLLFRPVLQSLSQNFTPLNLFSAEDFAVDDIQIQPLGPKVKIAFDNEPPTTIVKSVLLPTKCNNIDYRCYGCVLQCSFLQWQRSFDSGATWIDIPRATTNTYLNTFSTADTIFYRKLTGAEQANMNNINCRVVSNTVIIHVDGIPTGISVTNNSPVCAGTDLEFKAEGGASYLWSRPNGFYDNIPFRIFSILCWKTAEHITCK